METQLACRVQDAAVVLETFLGGMETPHIGFGAPQRGPLKPSLVEWKQLSFTGFLFSGFSLETFLGGMETNLILIFIII